MNSIFGITNYANTDQTSLFGCSIRMHFMAGNLDINNTLFTNHHTTLTFLEPNNPIAGVDYYGGGAIVIAHADNVRISNTNFT
jgi:UDP-2,3-diacylglucosamine pyrophosphatase LpxH